MQIRLRANSGGVSEIHMGKAYIERLPASGRIVGHPETDRLPVAGSISEWPVNRELGVWPTLA